MKKAFSLMEIVIAVSILSFVMVTLLEIKSNNIFLLEKSDKLAKDNTYILIAMNLKEAQNRNEDIFLDDIFSFDDDNIRRSMKDKKVTIKDKKIKTFTIENDNLNLNIDTYETSYSLLKNKKKLYSFKLGLSGLL